MDYNIKYRGYDIEIRQDIHAESPDNWGNDEQFIVYDHRDFYVKRKGFNPTEIFEDWQAGKTIFNGFWILPLYALIHSGVRLSLGRSFGGVDPGGWDTSFKGFVLIKRMKGTWTHAQARNQASGVITLWNEYLSGEVYGWETVAGSCWGYYGDYKKNGMIEEAKASIDAYIHERMKRHFTQLKIWIKNKVPSMYRKPLTI